MNFQNVSLCWVSANLVPVESLKEINFETPMYKLRVNLHNIVKQGRLA